MRCVPPLLLALALVLTAACHPPSAADVRTAETAIPGLPDFPGAKELDHDAKGEHFGYDRSVGRLLLADAPYPEVHDFYTRAVAAEGWTVDRVRERDHHVHWHLYRGRSMGDVELKVRADGVEIHLERHDRDEP